MLGFCEFQLQGGVAQIVTFSIAFLTSLLCTFGHSSHTLLKTSTVAGGPSSQYAHGGADCFLVRLIYDLASSAQPRGPAIHHDCDNAEETSI